MYVLYESINESKKKKHLSHKPSQRNSCHKNVCVLHCVSTIHIHIYVYIWDLFHKGLLIKIVCYLCLLMIVCLPFTCIKRTSNSPNATNFFFKRKKNKTMSTSFFLFYHIIRLKIMCLCVCVCMLLFYFIWDEEEYNEKKKKMELVTTQSLHISELFVLVRLTMSYMRKTLDWNSYSKK